MEITTEPYLGWAVMQVLSTQPSGEATVRALVKGVPHYVKLTPSDVARSNSRPREATWEQRVRNLKSHHKAKGNIFAEGYVAYVGRGRYRLTPAGWKRLGNKLMWCRSQTS
jgi:hypothetical protein